MHIEDILMKLNMSFLIKNEELIEKCNEIWGKTNNSINKGFDSESVYNEKYIKPKNVMREKSQIFMAIRYQKKVLKCIFLSVILTDSIFMTGKNYYPQVFLEECKHIK